jgi:hypothetical protein
LKSSLLSDLYSNGQEELRKKDEQVKKLQSELATRNAMFSKGDDIFSELRAQYPNVVSIFVGDGVVLSPDSAKIKIIQLSIKSEKTFSNLEKARIENWFRARVKNDNVFVAFDTYHHPPKKMAKKP